MDLSVVRTISPAGRSGPELHIPRPDLPWRRAASTECGMPLRVDVPIVNRDEVLEQVRRHGVQRTATAGVCLPCITATTRWPSYAADPVQALAREYADHDPRFAAELRALGAVVMAHRDEFDALMAAAPTDITARRRRR